MTPTLIGRWQTRLLLLATIGVLITLPFAFGTIGPGESSLYFYVLGYVALFKTLYMLFVACLLLLYLVGSFYCLSIFNANYISSLALPRRQMVVT